MSEKQKSEEKQKIPEKGKSLRVVQLRNRFFFMLYRYSTIVFISSLLCFMTSIAFLVFFARQPVPPQYIPINEDGTYIKLSPLSECKDDADVKKFALNAIKKLYKYDYINYADQLQDALPYFTSDGWNEYLDEYSRSNTLLAVKENKWIVTVQPNSLPEIVKKDVIDGICTWEIKTAIQISFIGASGQTPRGDLYMRIVRNSVINNPEGLGIKKSVFAEAKVGP